MRLHKGKARNETSEGIYKHSRWFRFVPDYADSHNHPTPVGADVPAFRSLHDILLNESKTIIGPSVRVLMSASNC